MQSTLTSFLFSSPSKKKMRNNSHASLQNLASLSASVPDKVKHIILADDDEDDCLFFQDAMQEVAPCVKVKTVQSGEKLINMLTRAKAILPDIIFLDLNMPRKSGHECLEDIKNNPSLREIPVVIYSTSSDKKDIDETFKKGANLFISKPNTFSEIKNMAKKVLQINWKNYFPKPAKENFVF